MSDDISAELNTARERFLDRYHYSQRDILRDAWESGAIAVIDASAKRMRAEAERLRAIHQYEKRSR